MDKGSPENKKKAYKFFVEEKGYSPEIALGIVGNLMQESHAVLDTTALGFDGTGSFGIAQWLGSRKEKLKEVRPKDYTTLRGQLEFIDWELNNTEKRAGNKIKKAQNIKEATLLFSKYYERPHKDYAHNDRRIKFAQDLGKELKITSPKIDRKNDEEQTTVDTELLKKNSRVLTEVISPIDRETISERERGRVKNEEQDNSNKYLEHFKVKEEKKNFSPQAPEHDLDYLYDYIKLKKDDFYTQEFSDGGKRRKKKIVGPRSPLVTVRKAYPNAVHSSNTLEVVIPRTREEYLNPITNKVHFEKALENTESEDFLRHFNSPITRERIKEQTALSSKDIDNMILHGLSASKRIEGSLEESKADYNHEKHEIRFQPENAKNKAIETHERVHASGLDNYLGEPLLEVLGSPHQQTFDSKSPGFKGVTLQKRKYLYRPGEAYGNFSEFRSKLGLKPGEKINKANFEKIVKKKKLGNEHFYRAFNNDKIIKALNTIAFTGSTENNNIG